MSLFEKFQTVDNFVYEDYGLYDIYFCSLIVTSLIFIGALFQFLQTYEFYNIFESPLFIILLCFGAQMVGSISDYFIIKDYFDNDEKVLEYNIVTNSVFILSNSVFLLLMFFIADGWTISYFNIKDKIFSKFLFHIIIIASQAILLSLILAFED